MHYEELAIEKVELDFENPRIKQYLSIYKEITSEVLSMALAGSSSSDFSSKYQALKESIKQNGGIFTPIIVNHITSSDRYIVIEGNTRLKFYQEFKLKDPAGPWDKIMAIVYDDMSSDEMHAIRLQAHMVGARDWDAFSKAKYLDYLYNTEKKSMEYLKAFCGGQESYIRQLIAAYNDMTKYYITRCEEEGIDQDPQVFSYFVELQKSGAKDALAVHGYDISDYTKWVIDERVDRAEAVRKLARVLGEELARKEFFKSNLTNAIKRLDAKDVDLKKIAKSDLYDLAKEVKVKLSNLGYKETEALKHDPKFASKREIIDDLFDEISYLEKNLESDE